MVTYAEEEKQYVTFKIEEAEYIVIYSSMIQKIEKHRSTTEATLIPMVSAGQPPERKGRDSSARCEIEAESMRHIRDPKPKGSIFQRDTGRRRKSKTVLSREKRGENRIYGRYGSL